MINHSEFQGPLAGLNVIDFGHYYAGPMVGMLLADQGANVIRIIRSGSPELPKQQYRLLNRNKRLLTLDLKSPEGKEQALSLIERADVVIENFRPGVMKRLGLNYASVKGKNPGLVYLSLPGFASTDKERAHIQAWEGVIAAAAGLYTEGHFFRQKLGFPPLYTSIPLSSAYGSMNGAVAIMAALVAREETGCGTVVEAPLVEAGLSTITDHYMLQATEGPNTELPDSLKPFVYSPDDSPTDQLKKVFNAEATIWGFNAYHQSADGRKMLTQIGKPWHAERLFKVLGLDEQLKQEGFIIESAWKGRWENNLAYPSAMDADSVQYIKRRMSEVMRTKTAEEWQAIMAQAGVPFTYVRTRDEWLALEPLLKSGVLTKMDNGQSELTVPGRVCDISGAPNGTDQEDVFMDTLPREPAPISVEQVDQWFPRRANGNATAVQQPSSKKGDLLKGLKVLDMCSIVAGPTAAYTLAQYGADVIRAEPPESFNLPVHLVNMLEVNQGKRSIVIDIKTAAGREILRQLVGWADVVLHNRLDDTAQRLGVTPAQLREINPNVVVGRVTALGGTWNNRGGWGNLLGYDPIANMPSGLLAHYGTLEYPLYFGGISADLMGGFGLGFSVLLGIYQRHKTGYAGEGRCSLARAVSYNQLVWMIAENDSSDWGEPRGQFATGPNWHQRIYRCADRWIYVETTKERAGVLAETVAGRQHADEQVLVESFAEQDSASWLRKLDLANIACHLVVTADDICVDAKVRRVGNEAADENSKGEFEILRWDNHPCGKPVMLPAMTWVSVGENHSYKRLAPASKVGEHTKEILRELDYSDDEIEDLIRLKVAHEYLPAIGNKDQYFFEPAVQA